MTACQPLPCSARVLPERMASVSLGRAAGRRWRAGAITALQTPAITGTRHQSKASPHDLALTRNGFVPVVPVTEDKLRTEKPNEINSVPVVPVVPVEMSIPRSTSASDALPSVPGGWLLELVPMAWQGYPPVMGPSTASAITGNSNRINSLANTFLIGLICSQSGPLRFIS